MLNGTNTMTLNEATLIAAVQHYFQTMVFADGKAPVVNSITASTTYSGGTFSIGISERQAPIHGSGGISEC